MYAELFQFPPGREGYYGDFGGAFIPEVLHETIRELTQPSLLHKRTNLLGGVRGVDGELLRAPDP
jgi:hypothetical protein